MPESQNNNITASDIKHLAVQGGKILFVRHLSAFMVNFSAGIVLARVLGPALLGLYFISFTVLMILRGLIDFGIGIHLIRHPETRAITELPAAYTLQQILGIAGMVVIGLLSLLIAKWYGHWELIPLLGSAATGAYFYSWQSIPIALMERDMRYKKISIIELSDIFAFNLTAVIGAALNMGIWGLVLGNVVRGIVPALFSLFLTKLRPVFSKDWPNIVSLANATRSIVGSNMVLWIINLAPATLIGSLSGPTELGIAQMAYNLLNPSMFIATIIQRVGVPAFSRARDDRENFNRIMQQTLNLLTIIYIPLVMGIASLSPFWVPFIYGNKWTGMTKVIVIAAVPMTVQALLSIFQSAFFSRGLASLVFKQNIIYAFLYWTLMAILARTYGALSLPVSHMVAMSAGCVFIWGYAKHCGKINYRPSLMVLFAGTAIMSLSWLILKYGNPVFPVFLWVVFLLVLFSLSSFQGKRMVAMLLNSIRGGYAK